MENGKWKMEDGEWKMEDGNGKWTSSREQQQWWEKLSSGMRLKGVTQRCLIAVLKLVTKNYGITQTTVL